jgi:type I restriction enzyme M protein
VITTPTAAENKEAFTPHAVAKIMARCLVDGEVSNVTCYDPSGSEHY